MQVPADRYVPSSNRRVEVEPDYSDCDLVRNVYANGMLHVHGRRGKVHLSQALAGLQVGLTEEEDGLWVIVLGPNAIAMYDECDNTVTEMPEPSLVEFPPESL